MRRKTTIKALLIVCSCHTTISMYAIFMQYSTKCVVLVTQNEETVAFGACGSSVMVFSSSHFFAVG